MDFDNRKVYGDTSITDGLVFDKLAFGKKRMLDSLFNHKLFSKQLNKMTLLHCIGCNETLVILVNWVIV